MFRHRMLGVDLLRGRGWDNRRLDGIQVMRGVHPGCDRSSSPFFPGSPSLVDHVGVSFELQKGLIAL